MDGLFHTRTSDSKRNSMHNTIMVMEDMISSSGSGARSVADGATVHLRLESLKSDAALKLLQQTTWKTFFTTSPTTSGKGDAKLFSINENSPTRSAFSASTTWPAPSNAFSVADFFPRPSTGTASGRSLASIAASRPMSPEILKGLSSSGPIDVAAALSHGNDSISAAFSEMVERVEDLWVDLKIPQADRNFYRESLCRGPPSSVQHCQEISRYILMLKAHRSATLAVVRAIEIREYALSKCMDLLYAMNRKSSRLTSSLYISAARGGRDTIRDLATANNSSSNTIIDGLSLDDFKSRSAASSPSDVTASLFRDELVATLRDIQLSSVDVIRLIQLWRRNLWRPYPFMHRREGNACVDTRLYYHCGVFFHANSFTEYLISFFIYLICRL